MRKICTLVSAFVVCGLICGHRVVAESPTRDLRVSPPAAEFKPDLLRLRFRRPNESARLVELALARRHHADHAELPAALADSIRFNLERRRISRSVLEAVRLFCQLDEPSLKDQQLALQTGENANTSVAVVGASELARRRVPEAFTVLAQLARSPDFARSFGMRRAVVNAAANYSTPEAVEFLIEILANHDGLLRYETARHLARLTKQNFGGIPNVGGIGGRRTRRVLSSILPYWPNKMPPGNLMVHRPCPGRTLCRSFLDRRSTENAYCS
ncbi:MAG: HEAT repeat domain-containing protein [Planctomycetales bacterium]